jgi:hypothetical protein
MDTIWRFNFSFGRRYRCKDASRPQRFTDSTGVKREEYLPPYLFLLKAEE